MDALFDRGGVAGRLRSLAEAMRRGDEDAVSPAAPTDAERRGDGKKACPAAPLPRRAPSPGQAPRRPLPLRRRNAADAVPPRFPRRPARLHERRQTCGSSRAICFRRPICGSSRAISRPWRRGAISKNTSASPGNCWPNSGAFARRWPTAGRASSPGERNGRLEPTDRGSLHGDHRRLRLSPPPADVGGLRRDGQLHSRPAVRSGGGTPAAACGNEPRRASGGVGPRLRPAGRRPARDARRIRPLVANPGRPLEPVLVDDPQGSAGRGVERGGGLVPRHVGRGPRRVDSPDGGLRRPAGGRSDGADARSGRGRRRRRGRSGAAVVGVGAAVEPALRLDPRARSGG